MKYLTLLFFSFAYLNAFDLPEEFSVTRLDSTAIHEIRTEDEVYATIFAKYDLSIPEYHLIGQEEHIIAEMQGSFENPKFQLIDDRFQPLGMIQYTYGDGWNGYAILSTVREKIATVKREGEKLIFIDSFDDHLLAEATRINKDKWTVKIFDKEIFCHIIHPHAFMALIVFQRDYDHWSTSQSLKIVFDILRWF